jgi:hypothetical protein
MGVTGLAALSTGNRKAAVPALATAVLMLVDPDLAAAPGFALSVLATGGLLVLAPGWRQELSRRLPGWLADALAVPAAAQVACGPVVVAMSAELGLLSVPANLLAVPAVAPATVVGVVAVLLAPVWLPATQAVAWPGGYRGQRSPTSCSTLGPADQIGDRRRGGSRGGEPVDFDANRSRDRNVFERAFAQLEKPSGPGHPLRQTSSPVEAASSWPPPRSGSAKRGQGPSAAAVPGARRPAPGRPTPRRASLRDPVHDAVDSAPAAQPPGRGHALPEPGGH